VGKKKIKGGVNADQFRLLSRNCSIVVSCVDA
jgi:hypothetical protein